MLVPNNDITFSCTGKERDEETGYEYFGARYYDSDLSGLFLSVDPMADKYLNLSPYAYCAWNPVKLVDQKGREIWIIGSDGNSYQLYITIKIITTLFTKKFTTNNICK